MNAHCRDCGAEIVWPYTPSPNGRCPVCEAWMGEVDE